MDTFDFFVLHNPKVFDSQDTSALPVFFLSDVFFGNTAGSSLPRHTVLSAVSFLLCPSYSTLSAISASGFSVLTLKKKYNRYIHPDACSYIQNIIVAITLTLSQCPRRLSDCTVEYQVAFLRISTS